MTGTFGFRTLKDPRLSTKLFSFNQFKITQITKGDCVILALLWLKGKLANESDDQRHMLIHRLTVGASLANTVATLPVRTLMPGPDFHGATSSMEHSIHLDGQPWRVVARGSSFVGGLASLMQSLPNGCGCSIFFGWTPSLGHCVAIYKNQSAELQFFDPRAGEYRVHGIIPFCEELDRCYKRVDNIALIDIEFARVYAPQTF